MARDPHSVSWEHISAKVWCEYREKGCPFEAVVTSDTQENLEEEIIALGEAHQKIHRRKPERRA